MIVAVIGNNVVLIGRKANIGPVPEAGSPMEGVLFVQLYVTVPPVEGVVKLTVVVKSPGQTT